MSAKHFKYVFLGGGNAGGYGAQEYIKLGGEPGGLAIITDEPVVSYERPALSKAYLFPDNPARLPGFHACVGGGGIRQETSWYSENAITYLTSTRVTGLDVVSKTLSTSAGDTISFEKLIVATGARPISLEDFKTPGADLAGIHYLRNVKDADTLVAAIADAKAKGGPVKAVCVGGGYIGMECAAALALNGLDVTVVFPESRFFERLFTPEIAAFYEKYYQNKGVKLIKGALAAGFRGENGAVSHTLLKNGTELESTLVIVGVGARPNVELFTDQLELLQGPPGGVKVDSSLRASISGVWAVGDVAAFPQPLEGGELTRQEHVQHARFSAAHAVADMLGHEPGEYKYLPYFYSRVFTLSWVFYGKNVGNAVHFGDFEGGKFGAFWVEEDHIVGGFLEGGSSEEAVALKNIVAAKPEAPADLADVGIGLASRL
jgi:monodehydroascorbate reductase (NADH)